MIDYSKLRAALGNLERQWENLESSGKREGLSLLDLEAVQESVIKRFDLALEMSWKLLLKYLAEEVGLAEVPNGPKPILRIADQNNLLNGRIAAWILYVNARNASSHDYSGEKAAETLRVIPDFLVDATGLYEMMSGEKW
ncbi:HI0074, nucleotidyltransferase substrate binding protein, HI0074 family [Fimbriimonadaceae bacterium]